MGVCSRILNWVRSTWVAKLGHLVWILMSCVGGS
ncbi:Glutamate dehydrogenase mitochondrial [Bienertia sinuspersici]